MARPRFLNFSFGKRIPNQRDLGKQSSLSGYAFGLGYTVDEFNLFSQVKDYRTDLLNGTNWSPVNTQLSGSLSYLQFIKMLNKYSTAIFNDYVNKGFVIFARIDGAIYYVSSNNYTKTENRVSIHGFPKAEAFIFDEPNAFCGEQTIFKKCEPFQRLYNIALSCQKNGMSKSGFVNVMWPVNANNANTLTTLTDSQIEQLEKDISENHGISSNEQSNMLIMRREMGGRTIQYDFSKLGILQTKQLCEEFVCSKLGVPYVLLPSSGQTFANYEQANKILYENHSKYCEHFTKFAKDELEFDITYKTIAEAGKGIV